MMSVRVASEEPEFGTLLARLRAGAGMSQEELAERAGLSAHAISALERGTRTHPYPHTVRSLADALELPDEDRTAFIASVPGRRRTPSETHREAPSSPIPQDASLPRTGLVIPVTPLFGRDDDIAAVLALARSGSSRLVTLTGLGGVGKTRLLAALARELATDYTDGAVEIALASLTDAAAVIPTIGRALDVAGGDSPDALEVVAGHLEGRHLLLVLDNFEHMLSAAADVGRLVSLCPKLMVLVSSRSPLRVRGEREYAVGPLPLPTGEVTTADELAASPSGALVLDRARALAPHLEMTSAHARALGQLCERLAGLPLALELATARLRLLAPEALLERLDEVASTSAARDLPERQRTMRATLDWSYGLLSLDQKALFALLSVFRSGARLEDLEEVAAASGTVGQRDIVDVLEQLVEHSLVIVRSGSDGHLRYDMLEPVAQYARSLLTGPDAARAIRAHAQVYAGIAERAAVGYELADQLSWLARSEAEEANLLVAIRRALDTGDGATAARIIWSLRVYWWFRGQAGVGRQWVERCLTADLPPALLGRVRLTGATMSYAAGDVDLAARWSAEADRLGMDQDDPELRCKSQPGSGLLALASGDLPAAAQCFRQSLLLCLEAGESGVRMRSLVHVWLGTVLLLQGDRAGGTAEVEQGLGLARERGDRMTTYVALFNLAQTAIASGEYTRARGHLQEGIQLSEQTQDIANLAYFLDSLAVVEAAHERMERVAVLLGAAQSLREWEGAKVYAYYVPDQSLRVQTEQKARTALGDDRYDDSVDVGRGMSPSAIVEFAFGPP